MSLPPFETVVADHGAAVLRVCQCIVGPTEAEDAWSETFLSALKAYPKLLPGSNIRGWLVTIAHRKATDRLRSARRSPVPMNDLPATPSFDREPLDPKSDLWAMLAALPVGQRHAVAYRYLADLTYATISEIMGVSEAAARRSAADGMAKLRKSIVREKTQ